jgi:hypothetical protein
MKAYVATAPLVRLVRQGEHPGTYTTVLWNQTALTRVKSYLAYDWATTVTRLNFAATATGERTNSSHLYS